MNMSTSNQVNAFLGGSQAGLCDVIAAVLICLN